MPKDVCQSVATFTLPLSSFCAGHMSNSTRQSVCGGDSGGPASFFFQDKWVLVGIVSTGTNLVAGSTTCSAISQAAAFDVFVSVRYAFDWINSTMNGTSGVPGITTGFGPNAIDEVEWYTWVAPLIGGLLCLAFIIFMIYDRRREAMRNRFKTIAYVASISKLFQDEVNEEEPSV